MKFKYVNNNAFSVYLPCERGGQALFREGQETTKQWFSRFTGKGQLTKISIKDDIPVSKKEPVVSETKGVVIENIGELAAALVKALGTRASLPAGASQVEAEKPEFDSSRSMKALASTMSKQRGKKDSNFDDLGTSEVVKKDQKTVDSTRDFLSSIPE